MNILERIYFWYCDLRGIAKLICLLELVNVVSFVIVRLVMFLRSNMTSPISVVQEIPSTAVKRTLVIEVGGAMGVEQCFDVFRLYYPDEAGVIFLDHGKMGYSIKSQLKQIDDYIIVNKVDEVRVVGISVGDHFARILADKYNAKTLPVNPEPNHTQLRPWAKATSLGGGIIAELVTIPAGWLSAIDWIPKSDEHFSLAYVADQFIALAIVHDAPYNYTAKDVAIVAEDGYDQFLLTSDQELSYLDEANFVRIKSDHGNTIDNAFVYKEALDQIFPSGTWE